MFFESKYDIAAMRKHFDRAEKNFNPQNVKSTDKEPSKQTFQTKLWFKMYAMSDKSMSKLLKGKNAKYFEQIKATNGDYSRRGAGVGEQAKEMYNYVKSLVNKSKDLKYSICGVYLDIYDNLSNLKWRSGYKVAFDSYTKDKSSKSLVSAYVLLYWSQVYALETIMLKLIKLTYDISLGVDPLKSVMEIQYENREFMDKVVIPSINVNSLIKNTKDPVKMIRSYISGEKSAAKAVENFEMSPMTSEEGAFFETLKKSAGSISRIILTGIGCVTTSIAAFTVGAVAGAAAIVATSIIFLIVLIPNIRLIIYYSLTAEVDVMKELELNREMLENNIAVLKEKLSMMPEGAEKEKLKDVISKQEDMYKDLSMQISKYNKDVDPYSVEGALDADEREADDEADAAGTDTNTDGDPDGGDFTIEI